MIQLFNTYIYQPILSTLVFIYNNFAFGDLGLAIILLTIFIRVILFPIFYKSAKDQALMARLQPHIKKIQLDHKGNQEEQAKKLLALYREHRLNPFSGIFLLLLQLPILIAIYQIFVKEITSDVFNNLTFLGLLDLSKKSTFLAVIAAFFQYFQSKFSMPSKKEQSENPMVRFAEVGRMMIIIGPVITFFILINFPAALGLYWTMSILFSLGQQIIINKKLSKEDYGKSGRKNKDNT